MASEDGPAPDPLDVALAAISGACAEAARIIEAVPDPRAAFDGATRLADTLRDAASSAAKMRAGMAAQVWRAEELSLAALAERIGVSKARAAQLVNAAKAGTREGSQDG